jgi:hypothetical protein
MCHHFYVPRILFFQALRAGCAAHLAEPCGLEQAYTMHFPKGTTPTRKVRKRRCTNYLVDQPTSSITSNMIKSCVLAGTVLACIVATATSGTTLAPPPHDINSGRSSLPAVRTPPKPQAGESLADIRAEIYRRSISRQANEQRVTLQGPAINASEQSATDRSNVFGSLSGTTGSTSNSHSGFRGRRSIIKVRV